MPPFPASLLRNAPSFRSLLCGITIGLTAFGFGQTVDNHPEKKAQVVEEVKRILTNSAFVPGIDFSKLPEFLESEKAKIEASNNDEDFKNAVNEALQKFGASHIVLTTPRAAESRRTNSTIGVGLSAQRCDEGLLVVRIVKDAPADQAGIQPGDIVTLVDGKPTDGIKGIPGPEGTRVTLTVKHPDASTQEYVILRAKFSTARPEELTWLDKDTAKLTIYSFDFSYDSDRVEDLMQESLRARNLILDLRDNGGGAVVNMEHLLGLLLPPDQPIGTFISKSLVRRYTEATGLAPTDLAKVAAFSEKKITPSLNRRVARFKGNIVVLVNGFSGSASEIAAAALRDTVSAKIVGTKSAGAVLVSVMVPAKNGFQLQFPLSDYVTIKGVRLEGTGVSPDIKVEDPKFRLPDTKDEVVVRALELVTKSKAISESGK